MIEAGTMTSFRRHIYTCGECNPSGRVCLISGTTHVPVPVFVRYLSDRPGSVIQVGAAILLTHSAGHQQV
jgi:hypothetical protein